MKKMPDFKLDFYTPKELTIRWTKLLETQITEDEILGYGLNGNLAFLVAVPGGESVEFQNMWTDSPSVQGVVTHIPISMNNLKRILNNSNKPITLDRFIGKFHNTEIECQIAPIPNYNFDKSNLVISHEEVIKFEEEHSENEKDILPGYLDPEQPYYSKEIAIAIKTHIAIYQENKGNQNQSPSQRVETWIRKHYPDESNAFYERITTVVLPKKKK